MELGEGGGGKGDGASCGAEREGERWLERFGDVRLGLARFVQVFAACAVVREGGGRGEGGGLQCGHVALHSTAFESARIRIWLWAFGRRSFVLTRDS